MMLDTNAPDALIFPQEIIPAEYVQRDGRWIGICRQNGRQTVQSLVSTNPFDYLRPEWTPGSTFSS